MRNLIIMSALFLTACGNGFPIVSTMGYSYPTANPIVTPYQGMSYPTNTAMPYYYCYFNGLIVQRNVHHPRYRPTWRYAAFEACI